MIAGHRISEGLLAGWLAIVIIVSAAAGEAQAQSLADLAQRTSERRATIEPSKVYTNASLPVPIVAAIPAPLPPPPVDELETMPKLKVSDFDDRGEDYWRKLAEQLRLRTARVIEDEAGLETRERSLAAGQGAARAQEHKVTLALLRTTQADRLALDMERLALEKQAKNAGIPFAWLR